MIGLLSNFFKKFVLNKFVFITLLTLASLTISSVNAEDVQVISGQQSLTKMLEKHQGKVIYLDFWASWCGPCRRSFPWMNEMQTSYQDKGFVVVSVNLDAEHELAEAFLKETPALFEVVYDAKGETAQKYRVKGMPTSYLIGRDGKIKVAHTGFFNAKRAQYESEIKHLLSLKAE